MTPLQAIVVSLLALAVVLLVGSLVARRQTDKKLARRRRESATPDSSTGDGVDPRDDLSEVHERLADGQPVRAVGAYRQATGADLVTAKNAVERLERDQAADQ